MMPDDDWQSGDFAMAVIQLNPRTPGQRFMQMADFSGLTKKEPEKSLLVPLKHSGGRNNRGRMTSRHRGGGHKRRLRLIDFKRNRDGDSGRRRGARIRSESLGQYRAAALRRRREDATSSRLTGSKSGDKVESGEKADIKPGNALTLKNIPLGTDRACDRD